MLDTSAFFNYFFIIVGFFVDILLYSLCYYPLISIVRIMYYIQILKDDLYKLITVAFFVLVESFLYSACCGIDLIVMVPIYIGIRALKRIAHIDLFLQACLVLLSLAIHYSVVDYGLFSRSLYCFFNLKNIITHFIIVLIMLYYMRGSQGNRSG